MRCIPLLKYYKQRKAIILCSFGDYNIAKERNYSPALSRRIPLVDALATLGNKESQRAPIRLYADCTKDSYFARVCLGVKGNDECNSSSHLPLSRIFFPKPIWKPAESCF